MHQKIIFCKIFWTKHFSKSVELQFCDNHSCSWKSLNDERIMLRIEVKESVEQMLCARNKKTKQAFLLNLFVFHQNDAIKKQAEKN